MQGGYEVFPWWLLAFDYVLGMVMWTLIGRAAMNLFLSINSDFFFMKVFVRMTNPVLRLFRPVTPSFLAEPLIPLFVAWFFYMIRFYLMPYLLGYSVMGMLSFPLESEFAAGLYQLFGN
ncbi:MAG: YggT family protein [Rhodobacteraceae bacterium]|nr:YggT family protein [Paracoccaceae bacterium]